MGKQVFIKKDNFHEFLGELASHYRVFVPVKKGTQRFYKRYSGPSEDIVIGEVRAFEPLKGFFSRSREVVARGYKSDVPHSDDQPSAIVGVKACDLKGFKVQDFVFYNEDKDPLYAKNREENLIISADCTCAIATCFCLALGIKPYPQGDFDLNLSEIGNGFLVTIGSDKGQALVEQFSSLFEDAQLDQATQMNEQRVKVAEQVEGNLKENNVPHEKSFEGIIEKGFDSPIWQDEAKTCVECGACNTVCPTCHCFLLYDQKNKEKMERFRVWDSCMIKDFARVAGGANPRGKLWMRLRNRFEKKFDFFPKVANVYACTGCGRCVSACPARIDIRKVLRKLVDHGTAQSVSNH